MIGIVASRSGASISTATGRFTDSSTRTRRAHYVAYPHRLGGHHPGVRRTPRLALGDGEPRRAEAVAARRIVDGAWRADTEAHGPRSTELPMVDHRRPDERARRRRRRPARRRRRARRGARLRDLQERAGNRAVTGALESMRDPAGAAPPAAGMDRPASGSSLRSAPPPSTSSAGRRAACSVGGCAARRSSCSRPTSPAWVTPWPSTGSSDPWSGAADRRRAPGRRRSYPGAGSSSRMPAWIAQAFLTAAAIAPSIQRRPRRSQASLANQIRPAGRTTSS